MYTWCADAVVLFCGMNKSASMMLLQTGDASQGSSCVITSRVQYCDGLRGALIVYATQDPYCFSHDIDNGHEFKYHYRIDKQTRWINTRDRLRLCKYYHDASSPLDTNPKTGKSWISTYQWCQELSRGPWYALRCHINVQPYERDRFRLVLRVNMACKPNDIYILDLRYRTVFRLLLFWSRKMA